MTPELTTADLAASAEARRATADNERRPQPHDGADHATPLFAENELGDFRTRWDSIQAGFVDEPRGAVEKADALVADAITKLAEGFARTRAELDKQWKQGDAVSTEDLRQALRHYRSFFTRLLEA